ncbi:MAG: hypothetical protein M0T73_15960 [Deltaproteobacteria bacterium]|nr:hypothetical protein [Deltaproteobacteria bacterium]
MSTIEWVQKPKCKQPPAVAPWVCEIEMTICCQLERALRQDLSLGVCPHIRGQL